MKIVPHHIIDSDDIPNQTTNIIPLTTPPIQPSFPTSSPVQEDKSSSCQPVEPLTIPPVQPSIPTSYRVQENNSSSYPIITDETGDINVSSVDETTDDRVELVSQNSSMTTQQSSLKQ